MQTTSATANTRERILHAGYYLLQRQGYHGTGLKQILDEAGVPKGSFYHYFESKEHLAAELITHYQQQEKQRWERDFLTSSGSRLEGIRYGLQTVIAEHQQCAGDHYGCLLATLSGELSSATPLLRSAIECANESICAAISADLHQAQLEGGLRTDIDAANLARLFWSAWQGATLQAKVCRSTAPLERVVALLLENFFTAVGNPAEATRTNHPASDR